MDDLHERMRRVRLLIETRYDYLPQVRVTDLGDAPGPAESRYVPCEACQETGRLGERQCPVCDGHRWRRHRKGDVTWDAYVEMPVADTKVATGITGLVSYTEDIRRLDASIARIQATLNAREGNVDQGRYAWERARTAYMKGGSYRELDRAMAQLRALHLQAHRLLVADVHGVQLDARQRLLARAGLAYVAGAMRGPVRVPAFLVYRRSARHAPTVAELAAEGMTAGAIARRLGIPKRKVKAMLKKEPIAA